MSIQSKLRQEMIRAIDLKFPITPGAPTGTHDGPLDELQPTGRKVRFEEMIRLLEKDRHKVAMELHDHIGQGITSLKIALELAQKHMSNPH